MDRHALESTLAAKGLSNTFVLDYEFPRALKKARLKFNPNTCKKSLRLRKSVPRSEIVVDDPRLSKSGNFMRVTSNRVARPEKGENDVVV